ncbi:hypothetical protein ACJX0J_023810 [Zea mays]
MDVADFGQLSSMHVPLQMKMMTTNHVASIFGFVLMSREEDADQEGKEKVQNTFSTKQIFRTSLSCTTSFWHRFVCFNVALVEHNAGFLYLRRYLRVLICEVEGILVIVVMLKDEIDSMHFFL